MRISVSDVDRLVYHRNCDYANPSIADIVSEIRREGIETDAMRRGTAFHHILEHCGNDPLILSEASARLYHDDEGKTVVAGLYEEVRREFWDFNFKFTLDSCLALPVTRELKAEKYLTVNGVPVTLVGKVDAIDGAVFDHKLTANCDVEKYADSVQWRCYLWMFDASIFQYNVFTHYTSKKTGVVNVKKYNRIRFYRYPGMEEEVLSAIEDYVEFCREHCPDLLLDSSRDRMQMI